MMVSGIRFAAVLTLLFGLLTAAQAQTTAYSSLGFVSEVTYGDG